MDIENQYQKRSLLKTSTGDYNLEWCRWRVLGSQSKKKKEIFNPNTKGYIHGALILKNNIYVFFGPDQNKPTASMYSYNLMSNEWKQWNDCNLPDSRDSFGLAVHQNQLFIFGGSSYDIQFGDLHAFNTMSCSWRKIQPQNSYPSPRNPLIFTDINNQFIFLYGGINLENGIIYNDAFLLVNSQWVQIEHILNAPLNLIGAKSAVCNKKIFVFGGEYEDQHGIIKANKHLYELQINQIESKVTFILVNTSDEKKPCPRTSHNMIGVGSQYIILIGGQNITNNKMLRDIWIFSLDKKKWIKVDPANGPIHPLSENSLVLYNSSIFIFGGLTQHQNMWNQQILALQFGQSQPYRSEICTNCIQRATQKDKQEKAFPKTVVLSSGFFYAVSLEIKHPFQAIQMLCECAAYLKASKFKIGVEKSLNQNEHIQIQFDGQTLQKQQFQEFICHSNSYNQSFSRFMINLKVACLRLGKTLIFITADNIYRKVFLFSTDSKVAPSFDENYGFFSYVQNISKGTSQSHEGKTHKELILNVLRSRVINPENILNVTSMNKILIFEKNILVTSEKVYYYQLISTNNDDITIYKSAKKLSFLETLGYPISTQPEISLSSYLSIARLAHQAFPHIYINKNQQPIQPLQYLKVLQSLQTKGDILPIQIPSKLPDVQFQCVLYISKNEEILPSNLGILIYHNDRLVNRSKDYFGELFKQQFFKTKFKKAKTIFNFLGVINVKKGLTLNYFQTWFKKNKNYYSFIDNLRVTLTKAKLDRLQRNLKVQNENNENSKAKKNRAVI